MEKVDRINLEKQLEEMCRRCRYSEVCDEYEFRYGVRLATIIDGEVRCPMYEED